MEMKSLSLARSYVPGKFQVTLSSLVVLWFAFCFHYLFWIPESKHSFKRLCVQVLLNLTSSPTPLSFFREGEARP